MPAKALPGADKGEVRGQTRQTNADDGGQDQPQL
jgi:hypothetical protein